MDSLTHIAIGACIGDLFLGRRIGKKAMLYGAIAGSLPDVDFIASLWKDTADVLMAHRGFTHSFLFAFLAIILLAFFFHKRHTAEKIPVKTWLIFLGTEIFIHIFLDAFNAYGIGWFEPFSHFRVSFNVIFVADPFFSIWPAIAAACLLALNRDSNKRIRVASLGLVFCSLYLLYCVTNKFRIDNNARYTLIHQGIHYNRYFTTPTAFNNWLWYVVAESDSGYHIGYRSVFDNNNTIEFRYFPRNTFLLHPWNGQKDLKELIRFSKGYYTAELTEQGIVFNDLRFGQIMGWQNRDAHFVFHYYLQNPDANHLVVQRGRFANWDWNTIKTYILRIRGN
ncbi:MAG TPA: metal-dependent hydrolase [Puia sp.]